MGLFYCVKTLVFHTTSLSAEKMEMLMLYRLLMLFILLFSGFGQAFVGNWVGQANTATEKTRLVLHITNTNGQLTAQMTLPDVGVTGWPAKSVDVSTKQLKVNFQSDSGTQVMTLALKGKNLAGAWQETQFDEAATIELTLEPDTAQLTERRIKIHGPAGKLGASLIMPDCTTPCPGVVFLHGSGPQPRDSSRFAAQTMAKYGIASVIFDKRGVGESEGRLAGVTFDDLAADGIAVAQYLHSQPNISKVGFFGHSQGGWIGPLAGSKWHNTAFVIASAGPAVSPAREAQWETVRNMRLAGIAENKIEKARQIISLWHDGVRSGNWLSFDTAIKTAAAKPWLGYFETRPSEPFANSYRAFMDYNPLPALKQLKAPLLFILAADDESIDSVETVGIVEQLIVKGRSIKLKVYKGYNHSMRKIGAAGQTNRWPAHPVDYFAEQAAFINSNGVSNYYQ
jgi:pimeloyl-ACP methyl ester carboxylesterase